MFHFSPTLTFIHTMFHIPIFWRLVLCCTILLATTSPINSQSNTPNSRGTKANASAPVFEVNKKYLDNTLYYLQSILAGKAPVDYLDALFFNEQSWKSYIEYLQKNNCTIQAEAIPIFQNFSKQLKSDLLTMCGSVTSIEVVFQSTRHGICPDMKVISVGMNFHVINQEYPTSKKIQLIEYNNQYFLFSNND